MEFVLQKYCLDIYLDYFVCSIDLLQPTKWIGGLFFVVFNGMSIRV